MSEQLNASVAVELEGISCLSTDGAVGLRRLSPKLTVDDQPWTVKYAAIDGRRATATHPAGKLRIVTSIEPIADIAGAAVISHRLENLTTAPVWVSDISLGQSSPGAGIKLGAGSWMGWNFRYCHTDNVRTENFPYSSLEYPYVRMLPVAPTRLGAGQDQPFPAIYLFNQSTGDGVVIGAATAKLSRHEFEVARATKAVDSVFEVFAIHHDLPQARGLELAAGQSIALDRTYVQIVRHRHAQSAYEQYTDYLAASHEFRGPRSPMRHQAMQCTWNYGVFEQQYEPELLETARCIAEKLPGIKWFLLDAGYLAPPGRSPVNVNFFDRFYPDPDAAVCKEKFPKGMRYFSDAVRALGLRPAIWWAPQVCINTPLYRDHPDWFLKYASGEPYRLGPVNGFLDLTVPAALEFFDRTLKHVHETWGFDGVKIDFWSQQFEDRRAKLSDPRVNAVQLRETFFKTIRKHLPEDGFIMTCIAMGMGNPFAGEYADAYRNAIDIGDGTWREQWNNGAWSLPTLFNPGNKTWYLNQDSAGVGPEFPDNENYFRLSWCWITMGMQEMGGRMERLPDKWIAALRKYTDRCDRGYAVRCADERAFTGVPLPECLYVDFPPDSPTRVKHGVRQSVAMFNWDDTPKIVSVRRAALGQAGDVTVEDFWTGERSRWEGEFVTVRLDGRSAMLWDVIER